jgi:hypothetical protein
VFDAHPAVASLLAAVDDLRAVDWAGMSAAAAVANLEALHTAESQLRAAQARVLACIDRADATVDVTGRLTRGWLIEDQCLAPVEADRRLQVARRLDDLPALAKAYDAGQLSADHASVIVKTLRHVPDEFAAIVENALVELSTDRPPHKLAEARDELLAACGAESTADEQAARHYGERGFRLTTTFDGNTVPDGCLTAEVAAKVRLALDAASRGLRQTGDGDTRTPTQMRHDALGEIAGFYLAHADTAEDTGQRPQLVVTIDYDTLAGRIDNTYGRLDPDTPIAPETIRRVACDAEIIPTLLGSRGEVLDIGRATRTWPTAIRRAARHRQNGKCAFPRCTRSLAELHHRRHWADGGSTALANAVWLCAFHHWLVHEGRWTLDVDRHGRHVFRRPDDG